MTSEEALRRTVNCLKHARLFLEKARSTRIRPKWAREAINDAIELVDMLIDEPQSCGQLVAKVVRICSELHGSSVLNSKAKSRIDTVILHLERALPVVELSPAPIIRSTTIPQSTEEITSRQHSTKVSWWVVCRRVAALLVAVFGSLDALGWHPFGTAATPFGESATSHQPAALPRNATEVR
jgi:hypothetical protein